MKVWMITVAVAVMTTPAFAQAPSPAGDWTGDLDNPPIVYQLGLHIDETAPGVFTGTVGSHETGRFGTPVTNIAVRDGRLSFSIPSSAASFSGAWDAAANGWKGSYALRTGPIPITFRKGLLPALPAVAGLDGKWEGAIEAGGMTLRVTFRITGGKTVVMDVREQGAPGTPVTALRRDGQSVTMVVPSVQGRFEGILDGDTITGTWRQAAAPVPGALVLKRTSANAALVRPQIPAKPYPYKEEEVAYDNPKAPGVRLGCTLTTPNTTGRHPAALMITASGAQDRDESLFGHRPFLILADALTRRGIAVLRCDDRGVGKTTGRAQDATISAVASDVEAGLAYLRARPDIDPKRIGLIGHSEGGLTGPLVASRDPNVAYVVMLAGVGVKVVDLMVEQTDIIGAVSGLGDSQRAANRVTNRKIYETMLSASDAATATATAKRLLVETGMPERQAEAQAQGLSSPIFREFFGYDPAPVLPKIKAPILAINGSKDVQVSAQQNLPRIKALTAGNPDVTIVELPGLNHLFQTAKTGNPSEYGDLEETFSPTALTLVTDWVAKKTR